MILIFRQFLTVKYRLTEFLTELYRATKMAVRGWKCG